MKTVFSEKIFKQFWRGYFSALLLGFYLVAGLTGQTTAQTPLTVTLTGETSPGMMELMPGGITNADPTITVEFAGVASTFAFDDTNDLDVTNGTVTNFSGSGPTYTFTVTPDAPTAPAETVEVTINIAAGAAVAGGMNSPAASFMFTSDKVKPTVMLVGVTADTTINTDPEITVSFSEVVTDFAADDITVPNATVSAPVTTDSGVTYKFTVTPTADGAVTITIAADAVTDTANNGNAVTSLGFTSDKTGPTITLAGVTADTTINTNPEITVTFSEVATGFEAGDITVTNGTVTAPPATTDSGVTYTFTVTPTADGAVTITIAADAVTDALGNGNAVTSLGFTSDKTGPTVVLSGVAAGATVGGNPEITATFSEPVTGFTANGIDISNGTVSNLIVNDTDDKIYTFTVTPDAPTAPAETVVVTINIAAGVAKGPTNNYNSVAAELMFISNKTKPTVTLTAEAPPGTTLAFGGTTGINPTITATFSARVTDFTENDINVPNGTVGNFSGSGNDYTFTVTPMAPTTAGSGRFPVTITIPADAAVDTLNNGNEIVTFKFFFDRAPTVELSGVTNRATVSTSPTEITLAFSEPVIDFTADDINVSNGTVSNFMPKGTDKTTYTFAVTPETDGLVTISIPAGVTKDMNGNPNTETLLSFTFLDAKANTAANNTLLPVVTRALLGSANSAIAGRIASAKANESRTSLGGHTSLAGLASSQSQALMAGTQDWKDLLKGSDFSMPLTADGANQDGIFSLPAFWMQGGYSILKGESAASWDGDFASLKFGVDAKTKNNMMVGLMLFWSKVDLNYRRGSNSGDYQVDFLSFHPYFSWHTADKRLSLWGSIGIGEGDLEMRPSNVPGQVLISSVEMKSFSLGGSQDLKQVGGVSLRLKGEISQSKMETHGTAGLSANSASVNLFRVSLETSATTLPLQPTLEAGIRHDGADGETGTSFEVNLGIRQLNPVRGLTLEGQARILINSRYSEHDFYGLASIDLQNRNKEGLRFSLRPSYGNTASSVQDIWQQDPLSNPGNRARSPKMDLHLAYGVGSTKGLWTPYSELTFSDTDSYRLGLRWQPDAAFNLDLIGEKRKDQQSRAMHQILLKGNLRF